MGIHLAPAGPPSASSVAHPGSRRGGFGDAIETSAENSRTPPREVEVQRRGTKFETLSFGVVHTNSKFVGCSTRGSQAKRGAGTES